MSLINPAKRPVTDLGDQQPLPIGDQTNRPHLIWMKKGPVGWVCTYLFQWGTPFKSNFFNLSALNSPRSSFITHYRYPAFGLVVLVYISSSSLS